MIEEQRTEMVNLQSGLTVIDVEWLLLHIYGPLLEDVTTGHHI